MPIVDLYSSRLEAQATPDVWLYDQIPDVLRVQVSNIVKGALGTIDEYAEYGARHVYKYIRKEVAHEQAYPIAS